MKGTRTRLVHRNIRTYVRTYIHSNIHEYKHAYSQASIHVCMCKHHTQTSTHLRTQTRIHAPTFFTLHIQISQICMFGIRGVGGPVNKKDFKSGMSLRQDSSQVRAASSRWHRCSFSFDLDPSSKRTLPLFQGHSSLKWDRNGQCWQFPHNSPYFTPILAISPQHPIFS